MKCSGVQALVFLKKLPGFDRTAEPKHPGGVWQHLETFGVVISGDEGAAGIRWVKAGVLLANAQDSWPHNQEWSGPKCQ